MLALFIAQFHINRRRNIQKLYKILFAIYIYICRLFIWDSIPFLYFTIIKMTEKMTISNVLGHVNQFEVDLVGTGKRYFYSYNSLCCVLNFAEQRIIFGRDWDYSKTTSKHLYAFLGDNYFGNLADKKTIQKAIEDGKFEDWTVEYDDKMK